MQVRATRKIAAFIAWLLIAFFSVLSLAYWPVGNASGNVERVLFERSNLAQPGNGNPLALFDLEKCVEAYVVLAEVQSLARHYTRLAVAALFINGSAYNVFYVFVSINAP